MSNIKSIERAPTIGIPDKEIAIRKKVLYAMLKHMGIMLADERQVTNQMVYSTRFIPVSHLLSGVVVTTLNDGFSYRAVAKRLPVTMRQVRTIVQRNRKYILKKSKKDTPEV